MKSITIAHILGLDFETQHCRLLLCEQCILCWLVYLCLFSIDQLMLHRALEDNLFHRMLFRLAAPILVYMPLVLDQVRDCTHFIFSQPSFGFELLQWIQLSGTVEFGEVFQV